MLPHPLCWQLFIITIQIQVLLQNNEPGRTEVFRWISSVSSHGCTNFLTVYKWEGNIEQIINGRRMWEQDLHCKASLKCLLNYPALTSSLALNSSKNSPRHLGMAAASKPSKPALLKFQLWGSPCVHRDFLFLQVTILTQSHKTIFCRELKTTKKNICQETYADSHYG